MRISDIMTTNVVTVPSTTSLADARRIIDAHGIKRLPIVDKGRLVGIVTRSSLDKAGPSQLTTFSVHELTYLLSKVTVREVMTRDPVIIGPDATPEEGVALAQSRKVGSLLVMEDGRLVGIATTNDFFYKILNPILGVGQPGSRISVYDCCKAPELAKALTILDRQGADILSMFTMTSDEGQSSTVFHIRAADPSPIINELESHGFKVERRAR